MAERAGEDLTASMSQHPATDKKALRILCMIKDNFSIKNRRFYSSHTI